MIQGVFLEKDNEAVYFFKDRFQTSEQRIKKLIFLDGHSFSSTNLNKVCVRLLKENLRTTLRFVARKQTHKD